MLERLIWSRELPSRSVLIMPSRLSSEMSFFVLRVQNFAHERENIFPEVFHVLRHHSDPRKST